ncbi:OmpA family protein [Kaistella antarctica]|uniref:Flagellar motor protein MotB n=1 Tax=Kaistella antarctica TaxID=266748 RepID=A0A448NNU7_9FLAO|nr:OmpA family protein [Kaistella antarctica]KEY19701.1 flagellar motor protein MotB [Kaistella antarctica]SEV98783.1 OmpA family protein [Kaistella antarctica]VEH96705.1 Root adhesin [Kaistella antarctica]
MALNIIDLIKGQLGPALISQAASQLGESESGISKAISGLLPAVVGGMANNADKPGVLDAITGASSSNMLGDLLGGSSNNSLITTVLTAIFGDKIGGIANAISTFSGVSSSSSNSLLNMVTSATLGSVGKYATDNNLGSTGITSLLNDQKGIVSSLLPAGLSLASLGIGNMFGGPDAENVKVTSFDQPKVEVNRGGNVHTTPTPDNNNNEGGSIWKWLLPLLLLGVAGWFLWNNYNKDKTEEVVTTDNTEIVADSTADMVNDSAMMVTPVREVTDIDLNGKMIKGYANGMEASMINFLKGDNYKNADDAALKDIWYNFDNVNFKMGSATELEMGSEGQIQNLAAILKSYPDAKIKIGGYTDMTGDAAQNKDLSQKRADHIKSELSKLGVTAQVVGAEGYGSEFAKVAATASDSERASDRKMAVRFTK